MPHRSPIAPGNNLSPLLFSGGQVHDANMQVSARYPANPTTKAWDLGSGAFADAFGAVPKFQCKHDKYVSLSFLMKVAFFEVFKVRL